MDELPWKAPEILNVLEPVFFKVTIVQFYETWYAFEVEVDPRTGAVNNVVPFVTPSTVEVHAPGEGGSTSQEIHTQDERLDQQELAEPTLTSTEVPTLKLGARRVFPWSRRVSGLLHAYLMIVSWLIFAPAAILSARHMKHMSTSSRGPQLWFRLHRGFQWACAAGTVLSFLLVFIDFAPMFSAPYFHGQVGATIVVLMAIQIVNGT